MSSIASLGSGVAVSLPSIKRFLAEAHTPGEVAGPAVAVQIRIHNKSRAAIDVNSVIVTLTGKQDRLGQPTTSQPYQPFSGTVQPGASSEGVYVFLLPKSETSVAVAVTYLASQPSARFLGTIS